MTVNFIDASLPLVSVAIPCFNHADYVGEALQSVIDQDYPRIELIIIDDGSADASVAAIQRLVTACQARFERFEFRQQSNQGVSFTLNEALNWCEGDYFSPMASDDRMLAHKISHQVKLMQQLKNKVEGIFGGVQIINRQGQVLQPLQLSPRHYCFKDVLLKRAYLPAPSAFIKTTALRNIGGYPKGVLLEDLWIWLHLLDEGGTLYRDNQIVCQYRQHGHNTSRNAGVMLEGSRQALADYQSNPLYNKALARHELVQARHLLQHHPWRAMRKILMSIIQAPDVLVDGHFLYQTLWLKLRPALKKRIKFKGGAKL